MLHKQRPDKTFPDKKESKPNPIIKVFRLDAKLVGAKHKNCSFLKTMPMLGTTNLRTQHLLGADVLQDAMAESDYSMNELDLSQLRVN